MTFRMQRRAILAGTASLVAGPAAAQTGHSDRPIRLVVPAGAGGPTDVVARILQPHLSRILGQPVVVENRAGASGNICREARSAINDAAFGLQLGEPGGRLERRHPAKVELVETGQRAKGFR